MTEIPYPYPNPQYPGHYEVKMVDITNKNTLTDIPKPPSIILKDFFSGTKDISDDLLQNVSERCLLSPEECMFWLDHLQTVVDNRQRGAKKAAETRRSKKPSSNHANPPHSTNSSGSTITTSTRMASCTSTPSTSGSTATDVLTSADRSSTSTSENIQPASSSVIFCPTCGEEEGEESETWIGCDLCDNFLVKGYTAHLLMKFISVRCRNN